MFTYKRPLPPSHSRRSLQSQSQSHPQATDTSPPRLHTRQSSASSIAPHVLASPATAAAQMLNIDLDRLSARLGTEAEEVTEEWVSERSREELSRLVITAERVIRERERELGLAASIGKTLLEKNSLLRRKHDALLSRLPDSPNSSIGSLNSLRSVSSIADRDRDRASISTMSFYPSLLNIDIDTSGEIALRGKEARGAQGAEGWNEDREAYRSTSTTPQPPGHPAFNKTQTSPPASTTLYTTPRRTHSRTRPHPNHTNTNTNTRTRTHSHTHTRTPSLSFLSSQNAELQSALEQLEQEASELDREGKKRLRGLEREIERLRGELEGVREEHAERAEDMERARGGAGRAAPSMARDDSFARDMRGLSLVGSSGAGAGAFVRSQRQRSLSEFSDTASSSSGSRSRSSSRSALGSAYDAGERTQSPTPARVHTHASIASLASELTAASGTTSFQSFPSSSWHSFPPSPPASAPPVQVPLPVEVPPPDGQPQLQPQTASHPHPHPHPRTRAHTLSPSELPLIAQLLGKIRELELANADLLAQREGMELRLGDARRGVREMERGIEGVAKELAGLGGAEVGGEMEMEGEMDVMDEMEVEVALRTGARWGERPRRDRSVSAPSLLTSPLRPERERERELEREEETVRLGVDADLHRAAMALARPFQFQFGAARTRRRKALPRAFLFPAPASAPPPASASAPASAPAPAHAGKAALGSTSAPTSASTSAVRWPLARSESSPSTPTLRHFPRSSSDEEELGAVGQEDVFRAGLDMLEEDMDMDMGMGMDVGMGVDVDIGSLERWKEFESELSFVAARTLEGVGRQMSLGEELALAGGMEMGMTPTALLTGMSSMRGSWRWTPLREAGAEVDSEHELSDDMDEEAEGAGQDTGKGKGKGKGKGREKGKGKAVRPVTPPQVDSLDPFELLNDAVPPSPSPSHSEVDSPVSVVFGGEGDDGRGTPLLRVGALRDAPASTFDLLHRAVEERLALRIKGPWRRSGTRSLVDWVDGWVGWLIGLLGWWEKISRAGRAPAGLAEPEDIWTDSSAPPTPESYVVPLPEMEMASTSQQQQQMRRRRPRSPFLDERVTRTVDELWLTLLFVWTLGVFVLGVARKGPRGVLMADGEEVGHAGRGRR